MMNVGPLWTLLGLALLVAAVGCATSAPPRPTSPPAVQPTATSAPAPTSSVEETAAPSTTPASIETDASASAQEGVTSESGAAVIDVGSQVGERVPDFVLDLGDGSSVTSQQLLTDNRPVFLFFFATW